MVFMRVEMALVIAVNVGNGAAVLGAQAVFERIQAGEREVFLLGGAAACCCLLADVGQQLIELSQGTLVGRIHVLTDADCFYAGFGNRAMGRLKKNKWQVKKTRHDDCNRQSRLNIN